MLQTDVEDRFKHNPFIKMKDSLANAQNKQTNQSRSLLSAYRRRDDSVLLTRRHPHLVKPYLNDKISR